LHEGYFEGELSVLLDASSSSLDEQGILLPIQALQRNLYLEVWDTFAQAWYKGAELVCYYCRKAGHIRAKCRLLQKQVCYGCGKNGHTVKLMEFGVFKTKLVVNRRCKKLSPF
jgi:hypothetical protein